MAGYVEFSIDQGADFKRALQLFDRDELQMDLTGASARMQFRRTMGSSVVMLEASTENGKLAIDGGNGIIFLLLTAANTSALDVSCVFDCVLTLETREILRAFEGAAKVSPWVTR